LLHLKEFSDNCNCIIVTIYDNVSGEFVPVSPNGIIVIDFPMELS